MFQVGYLVLLVAASVSGQVGAPRPAPDFALEAPGALARAAREQGDAARGSLVFFRAELACAKCHDGEAGNPLGPDLAKVGKDVTDEYLVESILDPSKVVKTGYETETIALKDGTALTGLRVEERPDAIVLRDPAHDGKLVTIARADIEERRRSAQSIMPPGLANLFTSRQQFLDLVRYLRAIADGGPDRARALRPAASVLAPLPLPEYERNLDHAGLIAGPNSKSVKRGEAIYDRVCANCHGTKDRAGSMPTSLRFASGAFKNGSDPYWMYQTLTHGFGQMPAQTWMVPKQKYDVIHYIRETFLKGENPSQYARVDPAYLARLPKGTSRGPDPVKIEPWVIMDYGPSLMATIEVSHDGTNFATKGIAVRLDPGPGGISRGGRWIVYDHDTMRVAGAWSSRGFIDWNGINFNGKHEIHPRVVGRVALANPDGLGWANPRDARFDDPRPRARDGRPYGPLPRDQARYRGLYHFENKVILSYTVGDTPVLEMPGLDSAGPAPVITRTFEIGPRRNPLVLQVAHDPDAGLRVVKPGGKAPGEVIVFGRETAKAVNDSGTALLASLSPAVPGTSWASIAGKDLRLTIPAGDGPLRFMFRLCPDVAIERIKGVADALIQDGETIDLTRYTKGGPPRWPGVLTTRGTLGSDDGPFAVDALAIPVSNPWSCQLRLTGFDFDPDGRRAVVCTWDGDVWSVRGIDRPEQGLTWQRIASGLFQPLGLKVVEGQVFVACRDQIAILRDLNGDGEADFIECFNSDHQVTEHFHEFAMDLQVDPEGNFYYAKGARHGKTALVPQHGTLLRVSPDGARTDILATGFRAPNGVCLNPDGTFFMTDQEGHWIPKNRINWVRPGRFYGNMWAYHDVTDPSDAAMEPPLCWITNAIDRSPAEIVRVESDAWGPLKGSLLSLSYGYGKVFVVPHERVDDQMQGGVCELPIPQFPTGIMRGRFHPTTGALYTCGMFAWAGTQSQPGGFYRVRPTGKPLHVPIGLHAGPRGMSITFSGPLDRAIAADRSHYAVKTWSLQRTENYGSKHINERPSPIHDARLSDDGRTVFLDIPGIAPTWSMEIAYTLKGDRGEAVKGVIHNTIHRLQD